MMTPASPEEWEEGYARGIDTYGVTPTWSAWGYQYLSLSVLRGTPEKRSAKWSWDEVPVSQGHTKSGRLKWKILAHPALVRRFNDMPDTEWAHHWATRFERYESLLVSKFSAAGPPLEVTLHLMPSELIGSRLVSNWSSMVVPLEFWISFPVDSENPDEALERSFLSAMQIVAHEHLHVLLAESGKHESLTASEEERLGHRWSHCVASQLAPRLYSQWAEHRKELFQSTRKPLPATAKVAQDIAVADRDQRADVCAMFRQMHNLLVKQATNQP